MRPAISQAMSDGIQETTKIINQLSVKKSVYFASSEKIQDYKTLIENPSEQIIRQYEDRSIVKEIDQMISPIRVREQGDNNSIELQLNGSESTVFNFNRDTSQKFHQIVSRKDLGNAVKYSLKVISLDSKNLKGKVFNTDSNKQANIHFDSKDDIFKLTDFLGKDIVIIVIAFPLIEYGAFDPKAGDIYFMDIVENG